MYTNPAPRALPMPHNVAALLKAFEQGIDRVGTGNYPPTNITTDGKDSFTIEMAVAGFAPDSIEIQVEKNELTVKGAAPAEDERTYLHRGLAMRGFERGFRLGEYVVVEGAAMSNGILTITLKRELPEEAKPRTIAIKH